MGIYNVAGDRVNLSVLAIMGDVPHPPVTPMSFVRVPTYEDGEWSPSQPAIACVS